MRENPFSKGFPSIDTCKNFCKSTAIKLGGIFYIPRSLFEEQEFLDFKSVLGGDAVSCREEVTVELSFVC